MTTDLLIVKGRGPGDAGRQVEHDTAMCHCGKEGQQPPGLHWEEHCQQVSRDHPSPLLSTSEIHLDSCTGLPMRETLLCGTQ